MSWDILVHAASSPPPPVDEMPSDWKPLPLGSRSDVQAKISAVLQDIRWEDDGWGDYDKNGLSLEFSLAGSEPLDGIMIHVRGGGDLLPLLKAFSARYGWYVLMPSEWMHHAANPEAEWMDFQDYRDQVTAPADEKPAKSLLASLKRRLLGPSA
ncbi:hypothetical protein [Mesorhizobium sp. YR577]|uniref:hypothetical protein n=1 Tax=Mesorhizobium sp. YR577 TaxID=1884373 RepID=UPI0008E59C78|nr:hypothetical protein [Mesorhizobium sp. YR577]SFT77569.1 hypothetical protein SAMN05518861_10563 [Mesorhizobium sp. YR577]